MKKRNELSVFDYFEEEMTEDEAIETPTKQLIKAYKTFIKELANEFQVLYKKNADLVEKNRGRKTWRLDETWFNRFHYWY